MSDKIEIREIERDDNNTLAQIVRSTLTEFKANKPGTVFFDESTNHLYELFQVDGAVYFVVLINNDIAGGAGIYPTAGLPADICELVKMYLIPGARRRGIAKILIEYCISEAKKYGYKKIYLETMPELTLAIPMYEKYRFRHLDSPMGNSGHSGCSVWMLKDLEAATEK